MTNTDFMRKARLAFAPAALLALGACATPFKADVTRFQQLPPAQGQSFTIQAADPSNDGGLEFSSYASLVAEKMQSLGYQPATDGATADLTVKLDYGIDEGRERRVARRDPFYDPWWGYGSFGYNRPYAFRTRHGYRYVHGYYDPFLFGGYGFRGGYGERSFTVYTSDIELDITRNSDGTSLFEGEAEAKSRSDRLTYLVPNLIEAMFSDFPGNNGETVRISVAPEDKAAQRK